MTTKATALFIVFGACIVAAPGRSAPDHLQPGFSTIFGWRVEGPYLLEQLLLAGQDERTLAAVVMPFSSHEWALLLHPVIDGHAELELRVADSSIWSSYSDGTPPPGFKSFKQPLGAETERALSSAKSQ